MKIVSLRVVSSNVDPDDVLLKSIHNTRREMVHSCYAPSPYISSGTYNSYKIDVCLLSDLQNLDGQSPFMDTLCVDMLMN